MEKIDLKSFCANDHNNLSEPFSVGKFSYATNGHVCVRVPRVDGIENGQPERVKVEELTYHDPGGIYKEFPEYKPTEKSGCSVCLSSGFASCCLECGGVYFDSGFHEYDWECQTCYGDGKVAGGTDKCVRCGGSGLVDKERYPFVDVDGMRLNTNLLDSIKDLPNVTLNTTSKEYALFIFDGGVGVVMGMHKD